VERPPLFKLHLALLALLVLGACEFPTETPRWQTTWVVPGEHATITASDFFPAGVTLTPDGSAFLVSLSGVTLQRTLGEMCGLPCQTANGSTVPKPAFSTSISTSHPLPADLVSAAVASGRVELRLSHTLGFDPIRPGPTARGSVILTLTRGSTVLGRDTIDGETTAFPANTPLVRSILLAPGTIDGPIAVNMVLNSPAGSAVRIETGQRLTVQATPVDIRAGQAQARIVATRSVTGPGVSLGLDEIGSEFSDRIQGGAILLTVTNPIGVSGTLHLGFSASGESFVRSAPIGAGTTEARLEFSREEIRSLFADPEAGLVPWGRFSAPGGVIVLRPNQAIELRTRVELIIGAES
jgi:hypothetical protein